MRARAHILGATLTVAIVAALSSSASCGSPSGGQSATASGEAPTTGGLSTGFLVNGVNATTLAGSGLTACSTNPNQLCVTATGGTFPAGTSLVLETASANTGASYAGSTPSACTAGQMDTGPALSNAGVLTQTCTQELPASASGAILMGSASGSASASSITDNGTTVAINSSKFTVTESNGNFTSLGSGFVGGTTAPTGTNTMLTVETAGATRLAVKDTTDNTEIALYAQGGGVNLFSDGNYAINISPDGTNAITATFSQVTLDVATVASSTTNKGTLLLSGGTGTVAVTSGAQCVCSDHATTPTACDVSVSSTTATFHGSGTDTVSYICF